MDGLNLIQTLLILGAAGFTAVIVINALFDLLIRDQEWHRWGPFD